MGRPNHWKLLIALALAAGIGMAVGIFVRTASVDDRTYRLCERIHSLAPEPKPLVPGEPGYVYYHDLAPPEENKARMKAGFIAAELFSDCDSFK